MSKKMVPQTKKVNIDQTETTPDNIYFLSPVINDDYILLSAR